MGCNASIKPRKVVPPSTSSPFGGFRVLTSNGVLCSSRDFLFSVFLDCSKSLFCAYHIYARLPGSLHLMSFGFPVCKSSYQDPYLLEDPGTLALPWYPKPHGPLETSFLLFVGMWPFCLGPNPSPSSLRVGL